MIAAEESDQGVRRKKAWVKLLRTHLENKMADHFKTFVSSIDSRDISQWLTGLTGSERTKKNIRDCAAHFFKWCRTNGYLAKDSDPMDGVQDYRKRRVGPVSILQAEALAKLLDGAPSSLIPYIAVRAFAGLRDREATLIEWQYVDISDSSDENGNWGFVTVPEHIAKDSDNDQGVRRLVPIRPVLREWLLPHFQRTGRLSPLANMQKAARRIAKEVGVKWKRNCLRHSYISYALAEDPDIAKIATESGNSPQVIRQSYLRVVKPVHAKHWFSVSPKAPSNVATIPALQTSDSGLGESPNPPREIEQSLASHGQA
jgi:integrase